MVAGGAGDQRVDLVPGDEALDEGFMERALELSRSRLGGEVQERAGGGGDGHIPRETGVLSFQRCLPVHADAWALTRTAAGDGDVDVAAWVAALDDLQDLRRGAVTHHGTPAARQRRAELARVPGLGEMADQVDAAVVDVEPPGGDPVVDCACAQAEREQLTARDVALLPAGERRDRLITGQVNSTNPRPLATLVDLTSYIGVKSTRVGGVGGLVELAS